MPQLSLYLDKKTMEIVEKMAKIEKTSISKWVSNQLKISVKNNWPDGYFDNFGALSDSDISELKPMSFSTDSKRKIL